MRMAMMRPGLASVAAWDKVDTALGRRKVCGRTRIPAGDGADMILANPQPWEAENRPACLEARRRLFSPAMLCAMDSGYGDIKAAILCDGVECVAGKFTYNRATRELTISEICGPVQVVAPQDSVWAYSCDDAKDTIIPTRQCDKEEDQRRYVNEASRLFVRLRNNIASGNIKSRHVEQLPGIVYLLDARGRYDVANYAANPLAVLLALACEAISYRQHGDDPSAP